MAHQCVIVGSDGSESALSAVRTAADLAKTASARLLVVTAYKQGGAEQHVLKSMSPEEWSRVKGSTAAEKSASISLAAAQEVYAEAESVMVQGDPTDALLSTAKRQNGDLIVVGNRGIKAPTRRLLGSVPTDVVLRAECDVLVAHTSS